MAHLISYVYFCISYFHTLRMIPLRTMHYSGLVVYIYMSVVVQLLYGVEMLLK